MHVLLCKIVECIGLQDKQKVADVVQVRHDKEHGKHVVPDKK